MEYSSAFLSPPQFGALSTPRISRQRKNLTQENKYKKKMPSSVSKFILTQLTKTTCLQHPYQAAQLQLPSIQPATITTPHQYLRHQHTLIRHGSSDLARNWRYLRPRRSSHRGSRCSRRKSDRIRPKC